MKELELKYGCNPNQKPSRIFIEEGELPIEVLNGRPGYINFLDAFNSPDGSYDTDDLQREMENHAEKLVREHPEIGALVFECTNMPPFAAAVQKKTGLPVFDYTTLANYVYSALVRKPFHGFL